MGWKCAGILSAGLRGLPLTIVSGMALGIDAVAHKAALEHNIHTIAVPGSGLDASVLYPRSHAALAKQILEQGGGLVSEFDLTWPAYPSNFPQRNRIMAGMCDATLVVEAELLSGTLITSKLALEYNRDILAVPGDVGSVTSAGPHMLIRLGATLVRGPQDVAEILGFELGNLVQNAAPVLTDEEKVVVEAAATPISVDELLRTLPFSASHANALLMMLELRGVITQHAGVVRVKQ
jgi:DNA processing protein